MASFCRQMVSMNFWNLHKHGSKCCNFIVIIHYDDVIMGTIASQITSLTSVYLTVYSGADQSKHQSSASLAFVWGIHRGPVNSPHKRPVTRKMFPFDDVIMVSVDYFPYSKVHWENMGPTWVLSAPCGSHVNPINLAIRISIYVTGTWTVWNCL